MNQVKAHCMSTPTSLALGHTKAASRLFKDALRANRRMGLSNGIKDCCSLVIDFLRVQPPRLAFLPRISEAVDPSGRPGVALSTQSFSLSVAVKAGTAQRDA